METPPFTKLTVELDELKNESARVLRRQIAVGLGGSICGIIFGYVAVTGLLARELNLGVTMLLCAAGSFWFVRFVMRDSTAAGDAIARRVKQLKTQITQARKLHEQQSVAQKLGVDHAAMDLYLTEVVYYPSWIQHSRARVPAQISEAVKVSEDAIELTTTRSTYLFQWDPKPTDRGDGGELTIQLNGSVVFRVQAAVSRDQWLTSASSYSVLECVQGPWAQELVGIWAESKECRRKLTPKT